MAEYRVVVGNIGTVYDGDSKIKADRDYKEYVEQSRSDYGRASREPVYMFVDGELLREHIPETNGDNDVVVPPPPLPWGLQHE